MPVGPIVFIISGAAALVCVLRWESAGKSAMYKHARYVLDYYRKCFEDGKVHIQFETRAQCDLFDWRRKMSRDQLDYLCLKSIDAQRRVWAASREQALLLDELGRYGPFVRFRTMCLLEELQSVAQPDVVFALSYMEEGKPVFYKDEPVPVLAIFLLWEKLSDGRAWGEGIADPADRGGTVGGYGEA